MAHKKSRRRGFAGLGVLPVVGLITLPKVLAGVAGLALLRGRRASAAALPVPTRKTPVEEVSLMTPS